MKKVMVVFGTRPEAIKMCPLVQELQARPNDFETIVGVTAQHRQMLDQVLQLFRITPNFDFNIMKSGQTLFDITSLVLLKMREALELYKPDLILVHGDTTTSFAAGLAAFYMQIPIGHVEAGLRTRNIYSPWPEEFNRQSVDSFSDYLFAPTNTAKQNLLNEMKPGNRIYVTGNTGIDALRTTIRDDFTSDDLEWSADARMVLVTAHRRENLGDPMRSMFRAIRRVVEENPDVKVIYPIHMNPRVRAIASSELSEHNRIRLIDPLDVLDFHNYLKRCYLVLTDSGGVQEEGPSLGKPVLVMRDTTERPEGVQSGTLKLVGTNEQSIYSSFSRLLHDEVEYQRMSKASNPYGDGYASRRIREILLNT